MGKKPWPGWKNHGGGAWCVGHTYPIPSIGCCLLWRCYIYICIYDIYDVRVLKLIVVRVGGNSYWTSKTKTMRAGEPRPHCGGLAWLLIQVCELLLFCPREDVFYFWKLLWRCFRRFPNQSLWFRFDHHLTLDTVPSKEGESKGWNAQRRERRSGSWTVVLWWVWAGRLLAWRVTSQPRPPKRTFLPSGILNKGLVRL